MCTGADGACQNLFIDMTSVLHTQSDRKKAFAGFFHRHAGANRGYTFFGVVVMQPLKMIALYYDLVGFHDWRAGMSGAQSADSQALSARLPDQMLQVLLIGGYFHLTRRKLYIARPV